MFVTFRFRARTARAALIPTVVLGALFASAPSLAQGPGDPQTAPAPAPAPSPAPAPAPGPAAVPDATPPPPPATMTPPLPAPVPVYAQPATPKAGEAAPTAPVVIAAEKLEWLSKFKVGGFVQPQLLWTWFDEAASPNPGAPNFQPGIGPNYVTAKADGTTTNPDFFRLRRARLKAEFTPTSYARFVLEIDPTPTGGPSPGVGTIARNVESVGIVRWPGGFATTEFGMGIFKIPFGAEVLQSDADRPFIERSWSENNLTPGEYDTGFRAYTSMLEKKLNVQFAVVNGAVQGERNFAVLPDLNKGKDLVGRVNYNFGPFDVGVSGMYGQGQIVDQPPATTLRFKQFIRKAFNLEAGVHMMLAPIGETRLMAEVSRAQNYDRGTKYAYGLPAIPANLTTTDVADLDEVGYFIRFEQDMTEWFTLAGRYDYYTPDSAQGNNGRDTFGAVGVVHFTKGLELRVEYSHATDNVHKAFANAPSKHIDTLSNVLQARF